MSQQEIEVILSRHLAEYLAMPILIIGPDGALVFYNEPAEAILGVRFDETGPIPAATWEMMFPAFDEEGMLLPVEARPVWIALTHQCPAHKRLWVRRPDGSLRQLEVTAFPLKVQAQRFLGALAIFWEVTP